MTPRDYDAQITERERWSNEAAAALSQLKSERDALRTEDHVEGAAARRSRIEDLEALIRAVNSATLNKVGVPLDLAELLNPLIGRPSPATLLAQIEELRARRDAAMHAKVDDSAIAGKFRFTGPGKHHIGQGETLRRVKVGEICELTVAQSIAFADKFEKVEEQPA